MEPANDSTQVAAEARPPEHVTLLQRFIAELENRHPIITLVSIVIFGVALMHFTFAFSFAFCLLRLAYHCVYYALAAFPTAHGDARLGAPNDILNAIHMRLVVEGVIRILKFIEGDEAEVDWLIDAWALAIGLLLGGYKGDFVYEMGWLGYEGLYMLCVPAEERLRRWNMRNPIPVPQPYAEE